MPKYYSKALKMLFKMLRSIKGIRFFVNMPCLLHWLGTALGQNSISLICPPLHSKEGYSRCPGNAN